MSRKADRPLCTVAVGMFVAGAAAFANSSFAQALARPSAVITTRIGTECFQRRLDHRCDLVQPINIFNDKGVDPRGPVNLSRERALRPIVQISGSTAFLVSPCYALAAHHGVFGFANADERRPVVEVLVPDDKREGPTSFGAVSATPEVWGDGHIRHSIREDWVLLKLSECEGKRIGWMELAEADETATPASTPVSIAGYPNDKPKSQLWRDTTGHISSMIGGVLLLNSAATRGGNSGSPLYYNIDEVPVVIGLQVRERSSYGRIIVAYDERQANIAIDIRHINRQIEPILSADKEGFWMERPELAGQNPAHLTDQP